MSVKYYESGILKIYLKKWNIVPLPEKPTLSEAEIYNQVMDLSFNEAKLFGPINSEILKIVGDKINIDVSVVNDIYKKVLLWQKSL